MSIESITSAIKARTQAVLGNSFTELAQTERNAQRRFQGSKKGFAILPLAGLEEPNGLIGTVTFNQRFNVIVQDNFVGNPVSDAQRRAQAIVLQDKAHAIYKDLLDNVNAIGAMLVSNLTISEPKYDQDTVRIDMTCVVRYSN